MGDLELSLGGPLPAGSGSPIIDTNDVFDDLTNWGLTNWPTPIADLQQTVQSVANDLPSSTELLAGGAGVAIFVIVALVLVLLIMGKVDAL